MNRLSRRILNRLPRRVWLRGLVALTVLFVAYVLAGFYLVPSLVRSEATSWVKANLDQPLALGAIKFNPFNYTLDIDDIALPATQQPLVAVGHLRVDFSFLSLFQSAYHFTEVTLDRPFIDARMRPDGSLNLLDLKPQLKPDTRSEGPSPAVKISAFIVNQGGVRYTDESQAQRPEETLIPIAFALRDFQTNLAAGGDFTLNAKSGHGEDFAWRGTLSIAPISSHGRLVITSLKSETVQKFLGEKMPVALTGGEASITADYDFAYGPQGLSLNLSLPEVTGSGLSVVGDKALFQGTLTLARLNASAGPIVLAANADGISQLTVAMPQLALQGLGVAAADVNEPAIQLADASLTDLTLDYGARKLQLGNLVLDGAAFSVRRQRNGQSSLLALLPPEPPVPAPAETTPARPWQISLGQFALNGAQLNFEDQALEHPARFNIAPLTVSVTGASSDRTQPVSIHFDTGINGKGRATGDATVTPADLEGDLKFTLTDLALKSFVPYLPSLKSLELRSGEANASGTVHFKGADLTALRFTGNAAVENFDLLETTTNSPFFAWRSLALTGIGIRNNRIEVRQANLVQPVGQVQMQPDRSFNFTPLMPPKAAASNEIVAQTDASTKATATTTAPIQATPTKPAWTVHLKQLAISGGSMGFSDLFIQPNFSARIDELKGTIANITNAPGQTASIDLSGQVIDQFSLVTIKGSMDLMSYGRKTDMRFTFRNIELPVFNPYSGRYTGYAIAKGKLTTELSYKIDNRALKADHHVIVDQLEWGQATDSKDAVSLPVRLATALLKDSKGVIDLNLPIEGSLDDPEFRVWPVIWQVVGNVVEKVVTAPFRLIGSLFAGADKAQYIDFAPGSASLSQGSAEALGALAKALVQRPELKLDIPAGPGIREDATAMADAAIDKAVLAMEGGKATSVAALDADDQHDGLEDLYRAKLGKKPVFPEFSADALKAAPGAKPDADDDDRRTLLETQWLRGELRKSFMPGGAELAALGTARATAVRNAFLADGSVDPARVFMATDMAVTANEGHARMELKFK